MTSLHISLLTVLSLLSQSPQARADILYVSTANLNTVDKLDSSGSVSVFASAGFGLNYPLGLAFDSSGDLFVANFGNSTIEEFSSNGTGSVFATSASGSERARGPCLRQQRGPLRRQLRQQYDRRI